MKIKQFQELGQGKPESDLKKTGGYPAQRLPGWTIWHLETKFEYLSIATLLGLHVGAGSEVEGDNDSDDRREIIDHHLRHGVDFVGGLPEEGDEGDERDVLDHY